MKQSIENSLFPTCLEYAQQQNFFHWLPQEIPVDLDSLDFNSRAPESLKTIVTNLFKIFTQLDIQVGDSYTGWLHGAFDKFFPESDLKDMRTMFVAFSNMENIHAEAYAHLITSLNFPESTFHEWKTVPIMTEICQSVKQKREFSSDIELAITLGKYIVNHEGLTLFSMFSILYSLEQDGYFKNSNKIVSFSIRDESLHVVGMAYVFYVFLKLRNFNTAQLKKIYSDIEASGRERIEKLSLLIGAICENVDLDTLPKTVRYCFLEQEEFLKWLLNLRLLQLKNLNLDNSIIPKCPLNFLETVIMPDGSIKAQTADSLTEINQNYARPKTSINWSKLKDEHSKVRV